MTAQAPATAAYQKAWDALDEAAREAKRAESAARVRARILRRQQAVLEVEARLAGLVLVITHRPQP